jgi:hippurate hydrolase
MRDWRRDFHAHPELAYEEVRTSSRVAQILQDIGLDEIHDEIGKTGVVGVLHGQNGSARDESSAVMFRCDMDALSMQEHTNLLYQSKFAGKMHACGHDGHMAMLLGAATCLAQSRNFDGTVYFCFQPAEEDGGGALAMINDGLFDRFPCHSVLGVHNWPGIDEGILAVRAGPFLAAADSFEIQINGVGGHAALPHGACDPIAAGCFLVNSLQNIIPRFIDPLESAVLTITAFNGGGTYNVIPDSVTLKGTVRSFDEDTHNRIYQQIEKAMSGASGLFSVAMKIKYSEVRYPPTVNDADLVQKILPVMKQSARDGVVIENQKPTMGAEDFSFMARVKPGAFIFIGNGDSAALHNSHYDFNDNVACDGAAYWVNLAEYILAR